MTVKELIERLEAIEDKDAEVFYDAYDSTVKPHASPVSEVKFLNYSRLSDGWVLIS